MPIAELWVVLFIIPRLIEETEVWKSWVTSWDNNWGNGETQIGNQSGFQDGRF